MEVIWSKRAKNNYQKTLDYWDERNGSSEYSDRIENETNFLIETISSPDCIYFGRYSQKLNLYVRNILDNRFQIYFSIDLNKNKIYIKHFKSSHQNSIE